jgi:hypothetical protein
LNVTVESGGRFPWRSRRASLCDAHRDHRQSNRLERDRLKAIVADRSSPQKHVWRASIVLATAEGLGTVAIMQRTAKSKTAVRYRVECCLSATDSEHQKEYAPLAA